MTGRVDEPGDRKPELPIPATYWIAPGRVLVGEFPGSSSSASAMDRLRRFMDAGVTCFVDLTEPGELKSYEPLLPMQSANGRRIEYLREPIPDHGVPPNREAMRQILATIEGALEAGHVVYIHCRAGLGRSATVAGCWLAEHGDLTTEPLDQLQRCWQQSSRSLLWDIIPETPEQTTFVREWRAQHSGVWRNRTGVLDMADRVRGALLGLAAGDAAGVARASGHPNDGQWTQHTGLALCLAESLLERRGSDLRDQIERYLSWQRDGHLSATGLRSTPTPDVAKALANYKWRGQRMAGRHDPRDRSTASLPRVLAAVTYAAADPVEAVWLAGECSRTTHQSPFVVDACRFLGAIFMGALRGAPVDEFCRGLYEPVTGLWSARPLKPSVAAVFRAAGKQTSGALTASAGPADAVQAVARIRSALSGDFEGSVRNACDGAFEPALEAALAGALAGAVFGAGSIPAGQVSRLARLDLLESFASRLAQAAAAPKVAGSRT